MISTASKVRLNRATLYARWHILAGKWNDIVDVGLSSYQRQEPCQRNEIMYTKLYNAASSFLGADCP
jgi:hypothetical protein